MALTSAGAQAIITALVSNKHVGLGLSSSAPGNTGAGFSEPSASEYRRVSLAGKMNTMTFPYNNQPQGFVDNNDTLYYPEAVTAGGWGVVAYFGLFSAATSGDLLVWGTLNSGTPVTINANTVPLFRANQLSVTVS